MSAVRVTLPETGALRSIAWWGCQLAARTGDKTLAWSMRLSAAVDHGEALLPLRFADGWPMPSHAGPVPAILASRDVGRWLEAAGFSVRHECGDGAPVLEHAPGDAPAVSRPGRPRRQPGEGPIPASTKAEARRIAVLFATAQRRINKRMPKMDAIAERVAGELQRAGIFNSRGQPYGVRYLLRHALVGVQAEAQNYRKHAPNASAQIER